MLSVFALYYRYLVRLSLKFPFAHIHPIYLLRFDSFIGSRAVISKTFVTSNAFSDLLKFCRVFIPRLSMRVTAPPAVIILIIFIHFLAVIYVVCIALPIRLCEAS